MRTLRQVHLYLGCIFAPLIIYFSISGAWQVFRYNDVPRDQEPTIARKILHELSKPHTNSTLPGKSPKSERSHLFNWLAALMGVGMVITSSLGIALALRFAKRPRLVVFCLIAGIGIPLCLLLLSI